MEKQNSEHLLRNSALFLLAYERQEVAKSTSCSLRTNVTFSPRGTYQGPNQCPDFEYVPRGYLLWMYLKPRLWMHFRGTILGVLTEIVLDVQTQV